VPQLERFVLGARYNQAAQVMDAEREIDVICHLTIRYLWATLGDTFTDWVFVDFCDFLLAKIETSALFSQFR